MNTLAKFMLAFALLVSLASLILWQATGGDWYTKFEVIKEVDAAADADDPLAAAGFYEGGSSTVTVTRDEFRFGLLPTPSGLIDKHSLSVASTAGPAWVLALVVAWYQRRRSRIRS